MLLTLAMVVSRWTSTILMFMSVLLNWSALSGAWEDDSSNSFPLSDFHKILGTVMGWTVVKRQSTAVHDSSEEAVHEMEEVEEL